MKKVTLRQDRFGNLTGELLDLRYAGYLAVYSKVNPNLYIQREDNIEHFLSEIPARKRREYEAGYDVTVLVSDALLEAYLEEGL
jgi:hypothetical protein